MKISKPEIKLTANPILSNQITNQPAEVTSNVAVVQNISRNVTKSHINEIFLEYGTIKGVYQPKDLETKIARNYMYVEFQNLEDVEKAILYMNGAQIDGCIVKVENLSEIKQEKPEKTTNKNYHYSRKKRSRSRSRQKKEIQTKKFNKKSYYEQENRYKKEKEKKKRHTHRKESHSNKSSKSNDSKKSKSDIDFSSSSSSKSDRSSS